jgi:hypothetical protein
VSLRRTDARFLLPRHAERALVLGALDPWREGLLQAGVEVLAARNPRRPDLVVAPVSLASEALASRADMVVLEGAPPRRLRTGDLTFQRLLARPNLEEPSLLLPVDDPVAALYAVERWSVVDRGWKSARLLVARELLRRRRFPNLAATVTVALRKGGPPFVVASAAVHACLPSGLRSLLTLGQGDVLSRNVFHLFPPGARAPAWVVKFPRLPGYVESFDRDERGLTFAARAGGTVARHAPQLLARFQIHGLHASVETAAVGHRLRELLLRPGRATEKQHLVDAVAEWILDVGRETAAPPEALAAERRRLAQEVVEPWRDRGASSELVATLPPLPAVLQHNDLGSWNIVVGPDEFVALDWESAREHGLPLWDLFYFLADALAVLDGSTHGEQRHIHTTKLFRGDLPSSEILFAWTRRAVAAAGVPAEVVGPIATLCWLHHALSPIRRRDAIASTAAGSPQPVHGTERVAEAWLADPALGTTWNRWQL